MKSMWVLVVALTSGPLAASAADEFYVAQDISTKQCAIVESPPTTTDVVLVEKGNVYFNRDEADRVVASHILCAAPSSTGAAVINGPRAIRAEVRQATKPKGRGTVDKPTVRAKSIFANSQPSAFVPRETLSSF